MTPDITAMEISITNDKAMLVKISLIVNASENLVVISPVLRVEKNFIGKE